MSKGQSVLVTDNCCGREANRKGAGQCWGCRFTMAYFYIMLLKENVLWFYSQKGYWGCSWLELVPYSNTHWDSLEPSSLNCCEERQCHFSCDLWLADVRGTGAAGETLTAVKQEPRVLAEGSVCLQNQGGYGSIIHTPWDPKKWTHSWTFAFLICKINGLDHIPQTLSDLKTLFSKRLFIFPRGIFIFWHVCPSTLYTVLCLCWWVIFQAGKEHLALALVSFWW